MTERQMEQMLRQAMSAADHAYCPYSGFRVGAAVLSNRGIIRAGCNVENASYGLTICAERAAIVDLVEAHKGEPFDLAGVVIFTPTPQPSASCGACRQFINEFAPEHTPVVSFCQGSPPLRTTIGALLPHAFGPRSLA